MSETDEERLILELIRRIDSKLDSFDASFERSADKLEESLAQIKEVSAQMAAFEKRFSDEIEDLRRLVEEYHAESIRETCERLRRASSPAAGTD